MTYSIVAHCPRTGALGLATTTYSIATGGRCEGVVGGIGISRTQAYINRANDVLAIELLAQGFTPEGAMGELARNDPDHEFRQIAIIDRDGRVAAHTGSGARSWAGHLVGAGYVAFGNVLAGPEVVAGIEAGFLADPDAPLEFRLLSALEGGRAAGGQLGGTGPLTERSALIRTIIEPDFPEIDVRVDLHDDALGELRRVLEEFKRYQVFYRDRGSYPSRAISQDAFVAQLQSASQAR
jgi:uncharacterized Ntn-hydrolase superfamily protein